jgi:hypothetical protein
MGGIRLTHHQIVSHEAEDVYADGDNLFHVHSVDLLRATGADVRAVPLTQWP